jgi:hypothetical protein
MPIFLYANVEIWRRCHVVFHELKHVLKWYTYLVYLINETVKQVGQQNLDFCSSCERQTLDPGAIDAAQGVVRLTLAAALSARVRCVDAVALDARGSVYRVEVFSAR